jgi:predicted Zn-dependent protease
MRKTAQSFRALSDEERSQIRVVKLEIVKAEQNETIAMLAERVKTPWSPQAIAMANRKPLTETLTTGERLKVGLFKAYVVRPSRVATTPSKGLVTHLGP